MGMSKYSPKKDSLRSKYHRQMKFFFPWFACTFVSIFFVSAGGFYALPFQILIMIFGVMIARDSFHRLCKSIDSRQWPKEQFSIADEAVRHWPSDHGSWVVTMRIKYQVEGETYYQSCHDLNNHRFMNKEGAESYIESVRSGERGKYIWYNPFDYQEAYLSQGVSWGAIFSILIGLSMIAVPLAWALGYITA